MADRFPSFLTKLPFEDDIDRVLDRINETIRRDPLVRKLDELQEKLPKLPEITLPTPLGTVKVTREINPWPKLTPPVIDSRRKEAIKASVAVDLAALLGLIPVVGDYLSEEISDIYMHRLRETLTPREMELFQKYDKLNPLDTMACVRALVHAERGPEEINPGFKIAPNDLVKAVGHWKPAGRIYSHALELEKQGMELAEAIEVAMREPKHWQGFEHLK